jgi:hypothetical protein
MTNSRPRSINFSVTNGGDVYQATDRGHNAQLMKTRMPIIPTDAIIAKSFIHRTMGNICLRSDAFVIIHACACDRKRKAATSIVTPKTMA